MNAIAVSWRVAWHVADVMKLYLSFPDLFYVSSLKINFVANSREVGWSTVSQLHVFFETHVESLSHGYDFLVAFA